MEPFKTEVIPPGGKKEEGSAAPVQRLKHALKLAFGGVAVVLGLIAAFMLGTVLLALFALVFLFAYLFGMILSWRWRKAGGRSPFGGTIVLQRYRQSADEDEASYVEIEERRWE